MADAINPLVLHTAHEHDLDEDGLPVSQLIATNYKVNAKGQYDPINGVDLGAHEIRQYPDRLIGLPPGYEYGPSRHIEPIAPLLLTPDDQLIIDQWVLDDIAEALARLDTVDGEIGAIQATALTQAALITSLQNSRTVDEARITTLENLNVTLQLQIVNLQQQITILQQTGLFKPSAQEVYSAASTFTARAVQRNTSNPILLGATTGLGANLARYQSANALLYVDSAVILDATVRRPIQLIVPELLDASTALTATAGLGMWSAALLGAGTALSARAAQLEALLTGGAPWSGTSRFTSSATMTWLNNTVLFGGAGAVALDAFIPSKVSASALMQSASALNVGAQQWMQTSAFIAGVSNTSFDATPLVPGRPQGSALLAATSALSARSALLLSASSLLAGVSNTGFDSATFVPGRPQGSALLASVTALNINTRQWLQASALIAGTSSIVGSAISRTFGNALFVGTGTIAGDSFNLTRANALLQSSGALSASAGLLLPVSALLASASALSADVSELMLPSMLFAGAGSASFIVTSAGGQQFAGSALLAGAAAFRANALRVKFGNALYAGAGRFVGNATVLTSSAWDPANKTTTAVLTSSNKVLSSNGTRILANARGTQSQGSGKHYFTVSMPVTSSSGVGAGLDNGTPPIGDNIGTDANSYAIIGGSTTYSIIGAGSTIATSIPVGSSDVINVAYDWNLGAIYFGVNGVYVYGDGTSTGSPSTNTNASFYISSATLFPTGTALNTTDNITINTKPTSPPTGFVVWG